jgi:hypothetical protein
MSPALGTSVIACCDARREREASPALGMYDIPADGDESREAMVDRSSCRGSRGKLGNGGCRPFERRTI